MGPTPSCRVGLMYAVLPTSAFIILDTSRLASNLSMKWARLNQQSPLHDFAVEWLNLLVSDWPMLASLRFDLDQFAMSCKGNDMGGAGDEHSTCQGMSK